jgi:hypothetical protein
VLLLREAERKHGVCLRLAEAMPDRRDPDDQFGTTVKPGKLEILDIDDTFCAAHGAQQLAFWNAHHDERGFASMHIYEVGRPRSTAASARLLCPCR